MIQQFYVTDVMIQFFFGRRKCFIGAVLCFLNDENRILLTNFSKIVARSRSFGRKSDW